MPGEPRSRNRAGSFTAEPAARYSRRMPPSDPSLRARRLLTRDRWAAAAGAKLVEVREGYARARMRLRPLHLNGVDVAQGGAVFTLADFAFAAASNSHGNVAVALDTSITFARAAARGVLTAEAREESLSRRFSVCTVRVTDEDGAVVALFRGTAFRKEDPIPERPGPWKAAAPGGGTAPLRARRRRATRTASPARRR
jgi:acyl-CoA thioesterase